MSKNKKAEIYSFKALSSQNSSERGLHDSRGSINVEEEVIEKYQTKKIPILKHQQNKIKLGVYRHEETYKKQPQQPELKVNKEINFKKGIISETKVFNHIDDIPIHPRIASLDSEIEQNIKRRLTLEAELNRLKKLKPESGLLGNIQESNLQRNRDQINFVVEKQFGLRNLQTHFVDQLIIKGGNKESQQNFTKSKQNTLQSNKRDDKLSQSIQILTDNHLQTILNNGLKDSQPQQLPKEFYDLNSFLKIDRQQPFVKINQASKNHKNQYENPTPPPITTIQNLLKSLTFPQIPKENVQKLLDKCKQLYAIHQSHSDMVYLLMVGSFHVEDYHGVRKYFKEILSFKKFQTKAYWVAAQTEYVLENFERCIKLTDFCMQNLEDKFLPRFLYLKAKCYNEQGNFTNSIVCYNQLIRIKSKIPQYYLQRAILYDKLGYEKECKEDYLMFGILKPRAKEYLQEKIIVESNDAKRKELLQIYKKII